MDALVVAVAEPGGTVLTGDVGDLRALGLGLALLAQRVDTRLRTKDEVERAFGLPVMAEIPRCRRRLRRSVEVHGAARESLYDESFRQLRTAVLSQWSLLTAAQAAAPAVSQTPAAEPDTLVVRGTEFRRDARGRLRIAPGQPGAGRYADIEVSKALEAQQEHIASVSRNGQKARPLGIVLVTSASPGEGKTTVATNLAAIFAETRMNVLVLDCDLRRPSVHRMFQFPDSAEHARARTSEPPAHASTGEPDGSTDRWVQLPTLAELARSTSVPRVRVAQVTESGSGQDALSVTRSLIAEARHYADIVVIDTAPVLVSSVAGALVPDVDGIVVVARAGRSTAPAVTETGERMLGAAPVFGVALVNAPPSLSVRRYYRAVGQRTRRGSVRPRRPARAARSAEESPEQPNRTGADTLPQGLDTLPGREPRRGKPAHGSSV